MKPFYILPIFCLIYISGLAMSPVISLHPMSVLCVSFVLSQEDLCLKNPFLSIEHLHDDLHSSARSVLRLSSLSVISAWMGGRLGRWFSRKMGVGVKKLKEKKKHLQVPEPESLDIFY